MQAVQLEMKKHPLSKDAQVLEVDHESLQLWHGVALDVGLQVGDTEVRYFSGGAPESDREWRSLKDTLPAAQVSARRAVRAVRAPLRAPLRRRRSPGV
jgi:hypothetical protein